MKSIKQNCRITIVFHSVGKITKQLVLLKEEKGDMERELEELRQNHRELRHKHDKLLNDSTGMITQEKHIQELSDVKR